MTEILFVILALIGFYLYIVIAWALRCGSYSKILSKKIEKFYHLKTAYNKQILMIGDSVMHGVGATAVSHSLPALVAQHAPHVRVNVFAQDGARCFELVELLEREHFEKQDQVIIFCGGMDVIKFTSKKKIKEDLGKLFSIAKTISTNVTYISPFNIGNSPLFLPPLSYLYAYRSKIFFKIAKKCTEEYGVTYLDYYHSKNDNFAEDRSHPNDKGYKHIFNLLKDQIIPS